MEASRLRISSGTDVGRREASAPIVVVTELRKRFELTKTAGLVFDCMWSACGGVESNGRAFRAIEIAVAVGCDPKSVTRAWLQLRGLKLVSLLHQGGRGRDPVYAVHDPERVAHDRVVAAPAAEQTSFLFDDEAEAEEMPGILSDKMPAIPKSETPPVTESAAAHAMPGILSDKMPGKRALHDHEMSLLKISSHDGAAARCPAPSRSAPPRAASRAADTSEESEESLLAQFHRKQRERAAIHAPLSTVGSLLALHDRRAGLTQRTGHGRDSPPCSAAADFEPVAGDGTGAIGELALKLQVRTADPAAEWRLFVDLARDVVEQRLPWETVKGWFDRMDRAGEKVASRGAVLRSNYKRYGRR